MDLSQRMGFRTYSRAPNFFANLSKEYYLDLYVAGRSYKIITICLFMCPF